MSDKGVVWCPCVEMPFEGTEEDTALLIITRGDGMSEATGRVQKNRIARWSSNSKIVLVTEARFGYAFGPSAGERQPSQRPYLSRKIREH